MNIIANNVAILGVLLLATVPTAMAQSRTDNSDLNSVEYRAGQLWTTGQDMTVTVLAIEDVHRVGKVVHVRIDEIPYQTCGDIHLTRAIEHVALTEKMMRKSELVLSKDNIDLPESSIDAYRKWEEQKKHQESRDAYGGYAHYLSDGSLRINGSVSDNLIPIPLDVQGDIELTLECWGDVVRLHGNSVSVELIGTAKYVEEFHPSQ